MNFLPPEVLVFLTATLPIVELRGSIPLGFALGIAPFPNFLLSFLGNLVPVIPLLWFLKFATERLRRQEAFNRFFSWLFARTRSKSHLVEELETVGLALFVAVPLPGTGVWTGCIAAYLFQLSFIESVLAVTAGAALAGILVMGGSLGIIRIFGL